MANVKFVTRGKRNPARIYVRFSVSREINYTLRTPLTINPDFFNSTTGKVRKVATFKDRDKMQLQLDNLENHLINQYNTDVSKGLVTGVHWLENCLNDFFNTTPKNDLNRLRNYTSYYIENLDLRRNDKTGEIGPSVATKKKYNTIFKKITAFEKYARKSFLLSDVNLQFREDFLKYLLEVEKLGKNTTGRYIKFLNTIVVDAQKRGYITSPELHQIQGFTVKVSNIYLSFDELEKINALQLKDERLETAKDWLIIGCYTGQRAGDLLSLTRKNISYIAGNEYIELVQQKTRKKVAILMHDKIKEILTKRGGHFPNTFCDNMESAKTLFNRYIKEVCKLADLNEPTQGARVNPETNRKESGTFEKWELVTSHICRRSFASNHYGQIPTPYIMQVTGHATEKDFLIYINKTSIDYATELAKFWSTEAQRQAIKEGNAPPFELKRVV